MGYKFVAAIDTDESPPPLTAPIIARSGTNNLPFPVTRMIGREDAVVAIKSRLSRERLMGMVKSQLGKLRGAAA